MTDRRTIIDLMKVRRDKVIYHIPLNIQKKIMERVYKLYKLKNILIKPEDLDYYEGIEGDNDYPPTQFSNTPFGYDSEGEEQVGDDII